MVRFFVSVQLEMANLALLMAKDPRHECKHALFITKHVLVR